MNLKRIHHIDFIVRDLDRAVAKYQRLFGVSFGPRERLDSRGAELTRFRLGDTWIVLVQPLTDGSPIKRFLDEHGEGFYHIAFEVEDLPGIVSQMKSEGVRLMNEKPRKGVEGWSLVDLEMAETFGVMIQLADPSGR